MIAQTVEIPKWALSGGYLFSDPRVQRTNALLEIGLKHGLKPELAPTLWWEMFAGESVPYTSELDQERKARDEYAPCTSAGEFWVMVEARKQANRYDDRPRDWPEWLDWMEIDDRLGEDLPPEDIEEEEEPWWEDEIPGTSPWVEFREEQRSHMVADMARAAAKGKKWAKHGAFQIVSLQALSDGKSFERARELGFMAYHASFEANVLRGFDNGLLVKTVKIVKEEDGRTKMVPTCKVLPWRYHDLAQDYLWPDALLAAARKRWKFDKNAALVMVVTAFANSLV